MMHFAVDDCHFNEVDFVVEEGNAVFFEGVYGAVVEDRETFVLKVVDLVVFILEHFIDWGEIDCLGGAEGKCLR
jgi:phosphoribulokinase